MKVRWTNSSVRFRITPAELDAITAETEVVSNLTIPGGGGWQAAITCGSERSQIAFRNGRVEMALSHDHRILLAAPQTEGVYCTAPDDVTFRYYIEKDFPCAHPRAAEAWEEPTNTFPAPRILTHDIP